MGSKTVAASTTNTAMAAGNNLLMTHQITSGGCKRETVDGHTVCTKIGHVITFTCSYPMKNQDITTDEPFKVSGSDTEMAATNTGSLNYKLEVDNTSFTIGSTVTATITPVTSGLVHATIESCSVKNKVKNESVKLIDDEMQRECALGVDITDGQGTGNLGFVWSSFKWSTELDAQNTADSSPIESQEVSCSISLSKIAPATETKNDCSAKAPVETPVKVTWTKTAGQWCTKGQLATHHKITLDECKTKCTSYPLKQCKFINFTEKTNNCYLMSAEQCAPNHRGTQSTYDIYQAVETPGN